MKISENEISSQIEKLIEANKNFIANDYYDASISYINHDEYEMAFEAIFLALFKARNIALIKNPDFYYKLGIYLQLDKNSVLDGLFWDKFEKFLNNERHNL